MTVTIRWKTVAKTRGGSSHSVPLPYGVELGDPPLREEGQHANQPHVGAPVVIEAARNDELRMNVTQIHGKTLAATAATAKYADDHVGLRVREALLGAGMVKTTLRRE